MSTARDEKEDKAMSTVSKTRRAHELLDRLGSLTALSKEQEELLRSFLPELPKQKTLEELCHAVYAAWSGTHGNKWLDDIDGDLETWLAELHRQLQGLKNNAAPAESAHPEFLETEADYAEAPEGTIAAEDGSAPPRVKNSGWPITMIYTRRRVLRWGWGE